MATFDKLLIVLLLSYVVYLIVFIIIPIRHETFSTVTITDIAKADLSIVGNYDDKMLNSLKFLVNEVLQKLKFFCEQQFSVTYDWILKWVAANCYDPDRKIEYVVHQVYDELAMQLEKGEEKFKWSFTGRDANLPEVSGILRCNDYVDVKPLYDYYYNILKGRCSNATVNMDME